MNPVKPTKPPRVILRGTDKRARERVFIKDAEWIIHLIKTENEAEAYDFGSVANAKAFAHNYMAHDDGYKWEAVEQIEGQPAKIHPIRRPRS